MEMRQQQSFPLHLNDLQYWQCPRFISITFWVLVLYWFCSLKLEEDTCCEVTVSYLEIYNENVIDLINPNTVLHVREDGNAGINIPGLSRHKPTGPEDLLRLLQYGNGNRTQHPTDANKESSRSHAVFQVCLPSLDYMLIVF